MCGPDAPRRKADWMQAGVGPKRMDGAEAVTAELVASLLRPDAFSHPADRLELHETHISWVILAGPFAYKIKKPVNLGFLDFTTMERRAQDCDDEIRLNRRLCPDVYLGVRQIVGRDGAYYVGGAGRPIEPVVWMRRLPEQGMLPALLARGDVTPALAQRIAQRLAAFHAGAATGPGVDEYGSAATIRANWDENIVQTGPVVGRALDADMQAGLVAYVGRFLTEQRDLLERRVTMGRIREGHGDLHAASICVEDGRIHLFDCLEFAPRFRCSDVAAEVSFLAMDFDHLGRADMGGAFVEAYVQSSGDRELLHLLDFYKAYRAFVRGKVASLRLLEGDLSDAGAAAAVTEAQAYFALACRYAGTPGDTRAS
jgi:aminoglycoside phosphotransferase family enzyme